MSIFRRIKFWIAHKIAAVIGYSVRHVRSHTLRRILIKTIFKRLTRWQKLEIESATAFGAAMHLSLPDSIQTTIFFTGRWEPTVTEIVSRALKSSDTFIDVGANVGYFTLLASQLVGSRGKVYAFEASPSIFNRLQKNISANGLQNVKPFNVAISDAPGKIWIWSASKKNLGHSTIMENVAIADGHQREAEVPCDAIDALVPLHDLLSARLIKIDIEGAERLAIEGVLRHLREFSKQTEWLVELSPVFCPGGTEDTKWIFSAFIDAGYAAYKIENSYQPDWLIPEKFSTSKIVRITEAPQNRLNDVLFSKIREHSWPS